MSAADRGLTRRGLLTGMLGAAAAATLAGRRADGAPASRVRVVRVESPKVWNGDARDPKVVAAMVERGVTALTGQANAADAWRQFFTPGMRVGLKINLLGRPLLYTAREVTEAVAAGAISAGVTPSNVIVWDRHADHFGPTVYKPGTGRLGERIKTGGRYDNTKLLQSSGGPCPLDTTVAETDVTVNLPVMKDHGGSGVTLALKNIAFGCYSHHRQAHGGNCDPYIAEAYQHYLTETRVPLIVLDATSACFDDGPQPGNPDLDLARERGLRRHRPGRPRRRVPQGHPRQAEGGRPQRQAAPVAPHRDGGGEGARRSRSGPDRPGDDQRVTVCGAAISCPPPAAGPCPRCGGRRTAGRRSRPSW